MRRSLIQQSALQTSTYYCRILGYTIADHLSCARAVTRTSCGTMQVAAARSDCSRIIRTTVNVPDPGYDSSTLKYICIAENSSSVVMINEVSLSASGAHTLSNSLKATTSSSRTVMSSSGAIPNYASSCFGAARYSSACSCWGTTPAMFTVTAAVSLYPVSRAGVSD